MRKSQLLTELKKKEHLVMTDFWLYDAGHHQATREPHASRARQ